MLAAPIPSFRCRFASLRLARVVVIAVLGLTSTARADGPDEATSGAIAEADAVVDGLHEALMRNLHSKAGCVARVQALQPAVTAAFDFDFIAQKLLRKRWKDASPAQREAMREAVADSAVISYAARFVGGGALHFERIATTSGAVGPLVKARLVNPGGSNVSFDYSLRPTGQGPRIVNVVAEGVSDLAVRSAQYEAVAARDGVDGLIRSVQARNQLDLDTCKAAR